MAEATERNARKVRQGIVSSIMGNKSIVVTTTERKRHPKVRQDGDQHQEVPRP